MNYLELLKNLLIHFIILLLGYCLLYYVGVFSVIPNSKNILTWDAEWYYSVAEEGYVFRENSMCNLAFFPLFPLVWKISFFGPVGISIVNGLIFCFSIASLLKKYELSTATALFLYSIPSLIFFCVPYSESLFFLFGTMLLIGFRDSRPGFRLIGFLGCSLIRSVSIIFIPTIIILFLFGRWGNTHKVIYSIKAAAFDILASLSGLGFTALLQWLHTGKWFYFIEIQRFWGREWHFPSFPLTTISANRVIGLDGVAYIVGLAAIFLIIKFFYDNYLYLGFIKKTRVSQYDMALLFSLLYISATMILDTCFTFQTNGSSNIWSLNRHVLATPFGVLFLVNVVSTIEISSKARYFLATLIALGIYFTGVYRFPELTFYYLVFFSAMFIIKFFPRLKNYIICAYAFQILIQLQFFHDFLSQLWVG